jgi:hypothetical protein
MYGLFMLLKPSMIKFNIFVWVKHLQYGAKKGSSIMENHMTFDYLINHSGLVKSDFVLKKLNKIFTMSPEKQQNYSYNIHSSLTIMTRFLKCTH